MFAICCCCSNSFLVFSPAQRCNPMDARLTSVRATSSPTRMPKLFFNLLPMLIATCLPQACCDTSPLVPARGYFGAELVAVAIEIKGDGLRRLFAGSELVILGGIHSSVDQ